MELKHCQICGRDIKTPLGFAHMASNVSIPGRVPMIAHHGYQRPGDGYQTPSCLGAKWRPYEVACDALPPAIAHVKAYIASQKKYYKEFTTNPPAELSFNKGRYWKPEWVKLPKPEGFDFAKNEEGGYHHHGTYESEHKGTSYQIRKNIEHAEDTRNKLEKLLADWKPQV